MKNLLFAMSAIVSISPMLNAMQFGKDMEPTCVAPRPASPSIEILRKSSEFRYFVRPQSPTVTDPLVLRWFKILKKYDERLKSIEESDSLVWVVTNLLKKSPDLLRVQCNYCGVCQLDELLDDKLCNHTLESERLFQRDVLRNMVATLFVGVDYFQQRISNYGLKQPYSIIGAIMDKAFHITKEKLDSPAGFSIDEQLLAEIASRQEYREKTAGYWTLDVEDIEACAKKLDQQDEDLIFGKIE